MRCLTPACGNPTVGQRKICPQCIASPQRRFWARVDKNGPVHPTLGECWLWTGGKIGATYGCFHPGGNSRETVLAHRYAWELTNEPAGELDHLCNNNLCVNPRHLNVVPV